MSIHQIGNSVPPQLARVLAISILSQVFSVQLPAELPTLLEGEKLGFRKRKRGLTGVYRAKASKAIGKKQPQGDLDITAETREYRASLADDFGWHNGPDTGALAVRCDIGDEEWTIEVAPADARRQKKPKFTIRVEAAPGRPWALGDRRVTLLGEAATRDVFVGVWKAFEAELARRNIKADLVQLCEYYQYQPRFRCQIELAANDDPRWEVLAKVVAGVGTREIIDGNDLAKKWGVRPGELLQLAVWLRSFGYEARNNLTNSQIPNGSFLVPYFFPTLTPLSVQLRKKMVTDNEQTEKRA